ncbi:MAG: pimeloyl-ACP methyl ester esterase BioH [Gammaproteobacteria bacterium]|nr:pimeloyl-ACP methyl ester esterase BioH [Gammaproteobacteria bacterium]
MLIHAETVGAGPACVLLHGWGLHGGVWEDVARDLATDHRVTRVDLPGHGRSAPPVDGATLEDFAAAVAGALPPRCDLIGWSLGGMVALRLAADHPDRVGRLILVAATPQFVVRPGWKHALAPEVLDGFAARLRADPAGTVRQFLALQVLGSEQERPALARLRALLSAAPAPHPAALDAGLAILRGTSLLPLLDRIVPPVTLIHGRRDTLIPWTAARAMQERLPQARLHLLPGAAHAPFLSHAEEFLRLTREALHGHG